MCAMRNCVLVWCSSYHWQPSFILSSRSHSLTPDPPGWQFSAVCKRSVYSWNIPWLDLVVADIEIHSLGVFMYDLFCLHRPQWCGKLMLRVSLAQWIETCISQVFLFLFSSSCKALPPRAGPMDGGLNALWPCIPSLFNKAVDLRKGLQSAFSYLFF